MISGLNEPPNRMSDALAVGCGSIAPLLAILALFIRWADPFLLSFIMFPISFGLPLVTGYLLFRTFIARASRHRIILLLLSAMNCGLLIYFFAHKALIWQWWL